MAVLWDHVAGDTHYQVRTAGNSIRLYTNGVFHSQYNPQRPVSGSVWDLLWIPAFFYPADTIKRVLVLGVGGGAVIQHLRRFIRPKLIVGIELSSIHLTVAKKYFKISGADVKLECADAIQWMHRYAGPPFDLIIDDLFSDADGEPERAVPANTKWARLLARNLSPNGGIVLNFASRRELLSSAFCVNDRLRRSFVSGFSLSTNNNHNAVGVFLRDAATTRTLRHRLTEIPEISPCRKTNPLTYNIRTLRIR